MRTYYLSGPMRGKPKYNFPLFFEVETALMGALVRELYTPSWEILNPARNFGGDVSLPAEVYLNADLKHVLRSDVIVLLPGWEESEGATREVSVAKWAGKQFMLAVNLNDDFGKFTALGYKRPDPQVNWEFRIIDELPSAKPSIRGGALDEAKALITGDRNNSYGPPTQDFQRSADALNAYGYRGPDGRLLAAHDIAIFVIAVKLSRLMWTPTKRDSWVDVAGYAGCGLECAIEEERLAA